MILRRKSIFMLNVLMLLLISIPLMATSENSANISYSYGIFALSAALSIGLAAFGGAIAQGMAARSALEGIARNPEALGKVFVPMILAFALIESLVLFSLLISFTILGKIA
jgi:F-type H+-transporting ATPase subunit c